MLVLGTLGIVREQAVRNADLAAAVELLGGAAVREQQMVHDLDRGSEILDARRVQSELVAEEADDPGLVDRHPARNAVAEGLESRTGVLCEALDRVALAPVERLREVPVVEGHEGLDPAL